MMAMCIRTSNTFSSISNLTLGKWYEIVPCDRLGMYRLYNDAGKLTNYLENRFKLIEDIREEKLKEIGI